jgi:hypothetical protein
MHLDHDHVGGHSHAHTHVDENGHEYTHTHEHEHTNEHAHTHEQEGCAHSCDSCATPCEHTPMEELVALMNYMVGHNAAHAKELADLAGQLEQIGQHTAYEQVMAAVSDFEKGNMRLSAVLASLKTE